MNNVKPKSIFRLLRDNIDRQNDLIIQTHDFPDHDAIAAAFALQQLFDKFSQPATICYGGKMHNAALLGAVRELGIQINHIYNTTIKKNAQIIIVDGCFENLYATDSIGRVIAVIDHHAASLPYQGNYQFADIRADYGACCTILTEYFQEIGIPPMPNVATALMMGIMMDTAHLTRGVNANDLRAIQYLFPLSDWDKGTKLLRNSLTLSDIDLFMNAIENKRIQDNFCFVQLHREVAADTIGILADFFLSIREIEFTVVVCCHGGKYRLSVRSENNDYGADTVLKRVFAGEGSSGGHAHMAGGIIQESRIHGMTELYSRFLQELHLTYSVDYDID